MAYKLTLAHEDNYVLNKFRIWKEMAFVFSDEGKPCQSLGRMKNSSYYIAPVGVRTHDLPHTVASKASIRVTLSTSDHGSV